MPHPPQRLCNEWAGGAAEQELCVPLEASSADKEQDLLMVAAEVQRMVECGGFRPIPVETVGKQLSMTSYMALMQHRVGLVEALEANPKSVRVTMHNGAPVISWYGVTWLGPGPPPPQRVPEPAPVAWTAAAESAAKPLGSCIMHRGKALENINQLAGTAELQDALRDMASCLLAAPAKTLLVSELGCKINPSTRAFLKTAKLRAAQLLQRFSEDFELKGKGPGTAVTYLRVGPTHCFRPQPRLRELNNSRLCRLLKLAADTSECCTAARGISCREVLDNVANCLMVDCRCLAERAVSVLPNSVAACDLRDTDLGGNEWVVAYCTVGCRAAKWCQEAAVNGGPWTLRLRYLVGGTAAWTHLGGQLLDPQTRAPTQQVHCWAREFVPFFPVPRSGYEVVYTPLSGDCSWHQPSASEALSMASGIRFARLRGLAWEVRLRYWPSVFCVEAQDVLEESRSGGDSAYVLVDCRTSEEREVSTILGEGFLVLNSEQFNTRAKELLANPRLTVVTFCTVGGRSGVFNMRFLERAMKEGLWPGTQEALSHKVVTMLGGIGAWLHGGGRLADAQGKPCCKLHPWCHAFLDLFPLEDLEMVLDEARPDPADALCFVECKSACEEQARMGVPQKLLQICHTLPPEVISDSLTKAMRSVFAYED